MADTASQPPRFPWDYDVPNDAFWNDVSYRLAGMIVSSFTQVEISRMTLDPSLTKEGKLRYLQGQLIAKLNAKEAGAPGRFDIDSRSSADLKHALSPVDYHLGNTEASEKSLRAIVNNEDGTRNIGAFHGLTFRMEEAGRYPEAETAARELLPLIENIQSRDMRNSPQAVGAIRVLIKSIWKQGRFAEAQQWIDDCRGRIESMGHGDFAKYEKEEREQFEEEMQALQGTGGSTDATSATQTAAVG